jgi:hypothetical protein
MEDDLRLGRDGSGGRGGTMDSGGSGESDALEDDEETDERGSGTNEEGSMDDAPETAESDADEGRPPDVSRP